MKVKQIFCMSRQVQKIESSGLMFIKAKKADAIQTGQEDAQIASLQQYTDYHRTIEEGWRTGTYSSDNSLVEDEDRSSTQWLSLSETGVSLQLCSLQQGREG